MNKTKQTATVMVATARIATAESYHFATTDSIQDFFEAKLDCLHALSDALYKTAQNPEIFQRGVHKIRPTLI